MDIVLILLALLCLWGIKINPKGRYDEYLQPKQTAAINGIFVVLVIMSHFGSYASYGVGDKLFENVIVRLGQLIVASFLFYSGYGTMHSLMHKEGYLKTLPVRFLKVLLHFDMAVLLFWLTDIYLNKHLKPKHILLSFIGWDSLGNSNWYIFAVLCLYIMTFIAGTICKNRHLGTAILVTLECCIFILLLRFGGKRPYWYNTIFCFPFGLFYAYCFDEINGILKKHRILPVLNIVIPFLICTVCHFGSKKVTGEIPVLAVMELKALSFIWMIVAVTVFFKIGNPILDWLGGHVFEIYILQRIPMILLRGKFDNKYIYFLICVIITLVGAVLFKRLEVLVDRLLFSKKKATSNKIN